MLNLLFSVCLSLICGHLMADCLLQTAPRQKFDRMLRLALGTGFGLGLSSCIFFITLLILTPSGNGLCLLDAGLHIGVIISLVLIKKYQPESPIKSSAPVDTSAKPILFYFFWGGLIISAFTFVLMALQSPYGGDDTQGIWNIRARVLLYASSPWLHDLATIGYHTDYPLLLPSVLARSWAYFGDTAWWISHLIQALMTYSTILGLTAIVGKMNGPRRGMIAGIMLLGTPFFLREGTAQQADVAVAYYILMSVAIITLKTCRYPKRLSIEAAAGLMASLAAWTKNEGILFVVVLLIIRTLAVIHQSGLKKGVQSLSALVLGMLPVLTLLVGFKTQIASVNDLIAGQNFHQTLAHLTDLGRYQQILTAFFSEMLAFNRWQLYPFIIGVYLARTGFNRRPAEHAMGITLFAIIAAMLLGYFGVYLTTPHDLTWHLRTSLHRLLLQLWPSTLLMVFLMVQKTKRLASNFSPDPAV